MAALIGHFNQCRHHRWGADQRLQHQQHRQPSHHELAKGQGESQQQLSRNRPPDAANPGQRFAQHQGGEHQGEQRQRQVVPPLDHRRRQQRQGAARRQQQAEAAGQQGLWHPPALQADGGTDGGADQQQHRQQPEGQGPWLPIGPQLLQQSR